MIFLGIGEEADSVSSVYSEFRGTSMRIREELPRLCPNPLVVYKNNDDPPWPRRLEPDDRNVE